MAETTPNNVNAAPGAPGPPGARDTEGAKAPSQGGKQETKKIVRLLTVVAYMMSVSMAAFMLSAYYIFLWNPKEHRPVGPLRLTDPCPECYPSPYGSGMGGHVQDMSGGLPAMYNESNIAETPRALPARDLPPVALTTSPTPLSRLALQYLQLHSQTDNFSDPSGNS